MTLPLKFRGADNRLGLNLDFSDVASGIGYVTLTGLTTKTTDSATITYFSLPDSFGSSITSPQNSTTGSATSSTSFVNKIDVDFDMAPNAFTTKVQGNAFCEVTWQVDNSGSNGASAYIEWNIIHVDTAASETVIGTVVTDTVAPGGGSSTTTTDFLHVALTETFIKPGEYLRLNIKSYTKVTGGTDGETGLLHNPKNEDTTALSSVTAANNHTYLKFHVPYKIEP